MNSAVSVPLSGLYKLGIFSWLNLLPIAVEERRQAGRWNKINQLEIQYARTLTAAC